MTTEDSSIPGPPPSTRNLVRAFVGARGIDTIAPIATRELGAKIRAAGIDFVLQYLGTVTDAIVENIVRSGLGFMAVTYANKFDGKAAVRELGRLNVPRAMTTWLDVEGHPEVDPQGLKRAIVDWSHDVSAAGYEPGMYVGPGCPLTSLELYQLPIVRYWRAGARLLDRNGQLAEPTCGFCLTQLRPEVLIAGVRVDVDFVGQDFRGRLPSWAAV
jgi:hypothetical protein